MAEHRELIRSVNHALVLTTAGGCAAFFWIFFHLPHSNLMLVSGAFLLTGQLYDIRSCESRLRVTLKTLFNAGMLQFLLGICEPEKFLQVLIPGLYIFFMLSMIRSKVTASTALLIGTIGLAAPPDFHASASRIFDLMFTGAAVMLATSAIGLIHYQNKWEFELPGAYTKTQALRIAVMYGLGIYLMRALHFPQGLWIVFSMAMIYNGVNSGRDAIEIARTRIFSTPLGLLFCGLYLACFAYFDCRMTYLIPLICGFGFFLLYYTGSYFAFTVIFLMTFAIYADIATGDGGTMNFMQMLCSRSLASVIGILIMMLYEHFFLPDSRTENKEAA